MLEVELWYSPTERVSDRELQAFYAILGSDEAKRSARFRFSSDRASYILSHGLLRLALSNRYGGEPAGWRFVYDENGRPDLDSPPAAEIRFSISHTRGLSVCGIAEASISLGCDAEALSSNIDLEADPSPYFSTLEQTQLQALPSAERLRSSLSLWTLKEAYLKAIGTGLARSPTDFSVSMISPDPPTVSECALCGSSCEEWSFARLVLGVPYAVSLAVHGASLRELAISAREVCSPDTIAAPLKRTPSRAGVYDFRPDDTE